MDIFFKEREERREEEGKGRISILQKGEELDCHAVT